MQGRCTRQYLDIRTGGPKQLHPSKLESRYERDDGHQRCSKGNVSLGMCPVGPCSSGYTVLFLFAFDRLPGVTGIVGSADPQGVTEYHKKNHEGIEVAESGDNERRGKRNSAEGGNVTWMEDGVGRP